MHTAIQMSERLMGKIKVFLMKNEGGVIRLAVAVSKHPTTVQRWLNAGRIPSVRDRYKLALACGCSEEEALEIASGCSSETAKTA